MVEAQVRTQGSQSNRPRVLQGKHEWHVTSPGVRPVLVTPWGGAASSSLVYQPMGGARR